MFKLFTHTPKVFATPTMTPDQLAERSLKARQSMGDKLCTATKSSFQYKSGNSVALKTTPPISFKNAKALI